MSFLFSSAFDETVDRATSENTVLGNEDFALFLDVSDKIKSGEVKAKTAANAFKKRLAHKNPNVQLLTLKLTDACVKNSGQTFLLEVSSRDFVDSLVSIARAPATNNEVKTKIFGCIQNWGLAFRNKPVLGYVYDVYNQLKLEGERFPAIDPAYTSSVLLETLTPPKWAESDVCFRCRNRFTTANRRHHCRQCGQSFCDPCSSKRLPLPHFGFQDPQRVCDSCSNKVSSGNVVPSEVDSGSLGISDQSIDAARKEQEELERAIALSLKEEEAKRSRKPSFESSSSRRPAPTNNVNDQEDEDLKRAIEVSLKEMKLSSNDSSMYGRTEMNSGAASSYSSVPAYTPVASYTPATVSASLQVNDQHVSSMELENIKMFVELVERLERDGANGHVLGNPQIQALHTQLSTLAPKLHRTIEDTVAKYRLFYDLHEKLSSAIKQYDTLLQQRLTAVSAVASVPMYSAPPSSTQYGYSSHQTPYTSAYPTVTPQQNGYASPPQPVANAYDYSQQQQQPYQQPAYAPQPGPSASMYPVSATTLHPPVEAGQAPYYPPAQYQPVQHQHQLPQQPSQSTIAPTTTAPPAPYASIPPQQSPQQVPPQPTAMTTPYYQTPENSQNTAYPYYPNGAPVAPSQPEQYQQAGYAPSSGTESQYPQQQQQQQAYLPQQQQQPQQQQPQVQQQPQQPQQLQQQSGVMEEKPALPREGSLIEL